MRKRLFVFFGIILAAVMLAGCGKKEFKVTFDVNGGTPAVAEQLVKKGELADVPTPEPTREGYTFEGWFLEETQWKFSEDKVTKTITLVAKWKEKVDPVVEKVRVVFDARGGTPAPDMQQVEKGKKAVKPADPVLAGQTFTGWYLDGVLFDFNTALNEDTTLVARYVETETVTVTFIASGGEPAPENAVIEKGTALPEPAEMTLDKHEFLGWFLNDELYNFELPVESNILLVAKWERIYENYTVTFDIGYEGGEEIDSQTVREEDYATEPQIDDRIGYRLLGWYDGDEKFEFTSLVLKDLNLVAKWEEEFVVSFDINYDEGEDVAPQLILKNEKANKPQIADREFYKFEGWFIDGEEQPFDFDTPITSDIHLVGKWTELDTYNITYHNVTDDMFVYGTKKEMVEAYLTDFYNFVDSGFALEAFMHGVGKTEGFDGLWVESNASIYNGAEPDLDNPNNLFFAYSEEYMEKWKPFHDMMHEFVVAVNETQFFYGAGTWTGLIRLRQYIISGGWEADEEAMFAPHINMMPNPLIKNTPVKVHLGEEEIKLLAPYRYDAEFLGWYDNAEFSGEPITVIPAGTEADMDLYAKWDEADRFAVTFDIGYPEGVSPDAQEVLDGHKATKPAEPARRPGHRFQGWFLEGAEVAFDFNTPITEAITLVAKWNEVNEAKVTFDYDTEGVDDVIEWVIVDSTISEPAEPEKENYRFLGWFVGDETDAFDFDTPITADITLVAKWEELDVFTITYNLSGGELFDGFATREAMLDAFLTDFYNFLEAKGHLDSSKVSLNDFMHGKGKTSGYDGLYIDISNEADGYFQKLYTVTDSVPIRDVAPETGSFINQVEYNAKWLPFLDLVEEYSQLAGDAGFWKSKFIGFRRLKPFIQGKNLWTNKAEEAAIILATIPNEYAVPRHEYNTDDETFYLPQALHPTLEFNGWYDNAEFSGEPIVKVEKGSTGNLDLYANFGVPLERYEVEYKLGYDELVLDSKMVLEGNLVVKPENPTRHLYEFLGWVLEGETELFDFENTIITGNIVLVATWNELAPMTVSFDLGYTGAPTMDDVVVGEGTMVSRPETDPERDEFVFLGWYLGETLYDFEEPVTADITLVAKWEDAPFTLIYNLVDGNLSAQDMIAFRNSEKAVATKYTTAIGWDGEIIYIGPDTGGTYWYKMGFKETVVPGVYELVGKGTGYSNSEATIYVAYHDDITALDKDIISSVYNNIAVGDLLVVSSLPGEYSSDTSIDMHFMDANAHTANLALELADSAVLITPVRDRFNFVGWYNNAELTGEALTEVPATLEDDLNLYPKWEAKVYYMVTFDTDGGNVIDPLEVETGHAAVEPAAPTKEGFVFLGWNLGTEPYDFTELVTEDITLIAQWRALEEYTVTFNFDTDGVEDVVENVLENAKVDEPANPLKDGHVFDGWFLGEATEPFDFDTPITGSIVLVARWTATETVTVSFDLNYEGEEEMDDVVIAKGAKVNEPVEPTREGYVFLGWFIPEATEAYDFNLNVDADLVLEARWSEIIVSNITYNVDGGVFHKYNSREEMITDFMADYHRLTGRTQGPDEFNVSTDAIVNGFLEEPEIVAKWQWLLDYIIQLSTDENHPETDNLIAKTGNIWRWTIHAFLNKDGGLTISTVDFRIEEHANGFWSDMPTVDPTQTYTEGQELVLEVPSKDGFIFEGWYDNSGFTGTAITKIETTDTGDFTLFAKWGVQLEEYTVSLDLGYDGKTLDPMSVTEGNLVTRPADPVREFYTFKGWVLQGETALFDFDTEVITTNITLVATWELNDVLVNYDFGEYGYVSDQTKLDIFTDFVTDFRTLYGRTGSTVQQLMDDFANLTYFGAGSGHISDIFKPEYKDGKWSWVSDYILDVATEANYDKLAALQSWDQTYWRTNLEGFFKGKQNNYLHPNETLYSSADFSSLEAANGFWRYTPYNKATQELSTAVLIDGSTIKTWNAEYVFAGWYDNAEFTGEEVITLPENSLENITLFAKWELLPTIDQVLMETTGTDVEFVGVVTGVTSNHSKVWVEDATGAITLYSLADAENVVVGGKYKISGKMAEFNGLIQIANGTFELIETGVALLPADTIIDIDDLTAAYQAKRVNLEGVVVSVSSNGQSLVVKVGENQITVRSNSDSADHTVNSHLLTAVEGQEVSLNNIHVDWYNGAQLLPISVDQVVFTPLTDAEKIQRAQIELTEAYNNKSFTMGTDIELPATSELGVAITWVTDPVDAIDAGKWKEVTADTPVVLTATLTSGTELSVDVTLNVTIVYFDPLAEQTYVEDFSFITSSGTSYSEEIEHTDANGFTWDLKGRPGGATGFGLGNSADGSYIKVTATGGISSFSIDIQRLFTNSNARSVELFVNGDSKGSFDLENVSTTVLETWTVDNIYISGDVIIELRSTSPGQRGAMDVVSFEWTTYTT